jgi:hypothetical protein
MPPWSGPWGMRIRGLAYRKASAAPTRPAQPIGLAGRPAPGGAVKVAEIDWGLLRDRLTPI